MNGNHYLTIKFPHIIYRRLHLLNKIKKREKNILHLNDPNLFEDSIQFLFLMQKRLFSHSNFNKNIIYLVKGERERIKREEFGLGRPINLPFPLSSGSLFSFHHNKIWKILYTEFFLLPHSSDGQTLCLLDRRQTSDSVKWKCRNYNFFGNLSTFVI